MDRPGEIDHEYEALVQDGITAARGGQIEPARRLLEKAAAYHKPDARPWIWLSATTVDPAQRRQYLELAVAAEPANAAARRGLVMLTGKVDPARLLKEGEDVDHRPSVEPREAYGQAFLCPQCGGRMHFDIQKNGLSCEFCGFVRTSQARPSTGADEKPMDFDLPTRRGHLWAKDHHRVSCGRCGAAALLPPGEKSARCPYCDSNQLIETPESAELLEPQAIVVMRLDEQQAAKNVQKWLEKGLTGPDDLSRACQRLFLRPAYYSFWTFDGTLSLPWRCEVRKGSGRYAVWEPASGSEIELFDDVLVPGLQGLDRRDLAQMEPFHLEEAVQFSPEFLAGWPAIIYDRSMSDASLLARETVLNKVRRSLRGRIPVSGEIRGLQNGAAEWSGFTYKHILLPLYIGAYRYQGRRYPVWVNGQTGKVGGEKPRDVLKTVMIVLGVILTLLVIALLLYTFLIPLLVK